MSADPLKPVAGVSLQKYAELAVKMRAAGNDREACAQIAAQEGIHRLAWEHAMVEWNSRLRSEATRGAVVAAYFKHYQRALLLHSERAATATMDAYVEMSAMIRTETQEPRKRPADVKSMCQAYGIDEKKWVEISRHWVTKLTHDPALFATYSDRLRKRVLEMDEAYLSRT
ncbi:MAG: hypothetical protein K8S25_04660 [Alphaproteobacteria bacterium]|nr:hypothetical protein [Alphaproteobacteria bacterium]